MMARWFPSFVRWRRNRQYGSIGDEPESVPLRAHRLSYKERLTLSPFEKMLHFRRVPFKLFLHLCVLALLTAATLTRNSVFDAWMDVSVENFRDVLQNTNVNDATGRTPFFSADDVLDHMNTVFSSYFAFPNVTTTQIDVDPLLHIAVVWRDGSMVVPITQANYTGLLAMPQLANRTLFQTLRWVATVFHFRNQLELPEATANYEWAATATYDFAGGSGRVDYGLTFENTVRHNAHRAMMVVNSLLVVACVLHSLLVMKALYKSYVVYTFAKDALEGAPGPKIIWRSLTFSDKLAFFNLWHVISLLGDFSLIISVGLAFERQLGIWESGFGLLNAEDVFRAAGILCSWFSFLKYLEWKTQLYALVLTLKASLPRVVVFIVTVTPIYIAFALVGVACFSEHKELFGDLFRASQTLFALLCGDSILSVFQTLQSNATVGYRVFAQIYLYVFCVMAITTINNVFIFIIESGYDVAKRAMYGDDPEPALQIDHLRLKEILTAANEARHQQGLSDKDSDADIDTTVDEDDEDEAEDKAVRDVLAGRAGSVGRDPRAQPAQPAVTMATLLQELRALRSEVSALKANMPSSQPTNNPTGRS
eukprot:m.127649 g.127649  ORF g.127649 m.127649 type:complete len:594 (-) comp16368_c1_seq1:346-2127(-)